MIINLLIDGVIGIGETKLGIERWEVGTIRRSDGDVPSWRPDFLHHAYWTMVQHGFPQLHSETGARILTRNLVEDYRDPILQAHPKPAIWSLPHINTPNEDNWWRLVCGDGGVN